MSYQCFYDGSGAVWDAESKKGANNGAFFDLFGLDCTGQEDVDDGD